MSYCLWGIPSFNMSNSSCVNPVLQSSLNLSSKDKFVMSLELPYVLKKRAEVEPDLSITPLQISVYGGVVPDVSVTPVTVPFAGQNLNITSFTRPAYPPLNVNFVVDNNYNNYFVLWRWLNVLNLAAESYYGGSRNLTREEIVEMGDNYEYQTNFSILGLNEYNQPIIEFKYTKAFITKLGSIQYSYRDGSLIEGSAEFHYSQLHIVKSQHSTNIINL